MTKSPLINWLLGIGAVCLLCIFCGYGGLLLPPFFLMFGWVSYMPRLTEVFTTHVIEIGITLMGLGVLTIAIHAVGRWNGAISEVSWRRSMALGGIIGLLLFVGVLANDGLFHSRELAMADKSMFHSGIREAGPRTHSINNLKQMGLAVHSHHDSHKFLPIGGTFDKDGRGLHGWQVMILPYIDQNALFKEIDLQQSWNSPINAPSFRKSIPEYRHPLIDQRQVNEFAASHYAGNVHVLGPMKMKLGDITDGTENTILTGEVTSNFKPWGSPTNWRDPGLGLHTHPDGFADGTVRSVRNDISPEVLKALSTPRGGEKVGVEQLDR